MIHIFSLVNVPKRMYRRIHMRIRLICEVLQIVRYRKRELLALMRGYARGHTESSRKC